MEKENTTIIDGAGKASDIKARIESIRQQAEGPASKTRCTRPVPPLSRSIEEPLRQIGTAAEPGRYGRDGHVRNGNARYCQTFSV